MAVTPVPIIPAIPLTTGLVALYTVPAGSTLQIRKMTVSNPSLTVPRNVTLYLVEPGQPTDDTTVIVKQKFIAPLATQEIFAAEGHMLSPGGKIWGVSDTAGMVIQASGSLIV